MSDDDVFRWVLIGGFVAILPVGLYHRLKAATSEKLDRRQEGLVLLVSIRLLAGIGMLGLLAFMIDPTWMAWASVPLPVPLRWAGVGVGVLAGSLLTWTFRSLGKNITDTVVTRKEHSLVTTGPYRWVRHPFYVSFALAVLMMSLITANWFAFITSSVVFLLLVIRTSKEEEKLIERFGDEYRLYMDQTGRFWPRLFHRKPGEP
ncbi:MAG: isoprenylcysteine carboxylmethyltransferase family protein [Planctomycetes bacterium]|nr:isoprenylcysteine carboxylmethyltransferase family protein [Planctomycetota bacterium]